MNMFQFKTINKYIGLLKWSKSWFELECELYDCSRCHFFKKEVCILKLAEEYQTKLTSDKYLDNCPPSNEAKDKYEDWKTTAYKGGLLG